VSKLAKIFSYNIGNPKAFSMMHYMTSIPFIDITINEYGPIYIGSNNLEVQRFHHYFKKFIDVIC